MESRYHHGFKKQVSDHTGSSNRSIGFNYLRVAKRLTRLTPSQMHPVHYSTNSSSYTRKLLQPLLLAPGARCTIISFGSQGDIDDDFRQVTWETGYLDPDYSVLVWSLGDPEILLLYPFLRVLCHLYYASLRNRVRVYDWVCRRTLRIQAGCRIPRGIVFYSFFYIS